jgi:hypothetical protein
VGIATAAAGGQRGQRRRGRWRAGLAPRGERDGHRDERLRLRWRRGAHPCSRNGARERQLLALPLPCAHRGKCGHEHVRRARLNARCASRALPEASLVRAISPLRQCEHCHLCRHLERRVARCRGRDECRGRRAQRRRCGRGVVCAMARQRAVKRYEQRAQHDIVTSVCRTADERSQRVKRLRARGLALQLRGLDVLEPLDARRELACLHLCVVA